MYFFILPCLVDEEILWELFLQIGPVVYVHIPKVCLFVFFFFFFFFFVCSLAHVLFKDKVTGQHQGFGFVEFAGELDAEYACKVMGGIKVYGKPIRCNKASAQKKGVVSYDVGANLFIGNLSAEVDERLLYDTFSRFGVIIATPKIMRDAESAESKGYAFVSFGDFESSDAAIAALNGQYLAGKPISVSYAIKKDSKGERHGSEAERMLANQKRMAQGAPQQIPRPQSSMAPQSFMSAPPSSFAPPPPPQFNRPQMPPPPPFLQHPQHQQQMRGGYPMQNFAPPAAMQYGIGGGVNFPPPYQQQPPQAWQQRPQ